MNQNRTKKTILINSAKTIFIEKGYDQTTVEEICNIAGVAKGTFFYYFETKQHIIYEMLRQQVVEIKREFNRNLAYANSSLEKLDLALDIIFSPKEKHMETVSYLLGDTSGWVQNALYDIKIEMLCPIFSDIIMEGKNHGIFNVENIDITCSVLINGLNAYYSSNEKEFKDPKVCKQIYKGVDEIVNKILDINISGKLVS
jgi:AcrR family transcriptional regulator